MNKFLIPLALLVLGCNQSAKSGNKQESSHIPVSSATLPKERPPSLTEKQNLEAKPISDLVKEVQCKSVSSPSLSEEHVELLGMLDEYVSRFDYHTGEPRPGSVEHFYPNEKAIADSFEELLGRTFGKGVKVEREVGGQGQIAFKSKPVADAINGQYLKLPSKTATLNPCVVQGWNASQSKAYLRGMLRRFGKEEGGKVHLTMANASWKMRIAAAIAVGLDARILSFYTTPSVPTGYELEFQLPK